MKDNSTSRIVDLFFLVLVVFISVLILSSLMVYAVPQPTSPEGMFNISSESPLPSSGYALTTNGGTITVVNINATTQNSHWKAYVGNVSGRLALRDANNNAVYDWNLTSAEGEIYATRKSSVVDWNNIRCANLSNMRSEELSLNMTSTSEDNIAVTFNKRNHSAFYAGVTPISANSCNSTNLFVNNAESDKFQQAVLYDGTGLVYTAILENSIIGFDGNKYDFEMILPDSGLEGEVAPATYYFYVELV